MAKYGDDYEAVVDITTRQNLQLRGLKVKKKKGKKKGKKGKDEEAVEKQRGKEKGKVGRKGGYVEREVSGAYSLCI